MPATTTQRKAKKTKAGRSRKRRFKYSGKKNVFRCTGNIICAPCGTCENCGASVELLCIEARHTLHNPHPGLYYVGAERGSIVTCRRCAVRLESEESPIIINQVPPKRTKNGNAMKWAFGYRIVAFQKDGKFNWLVDDCGETTFSQRAEGHEHHALGYAKQKAKELALAEGED